MHCSLPRRSGARFWRVSGHAGLGFRRLGRHVLACRSLRLEFHDRMLFVRSAWPWPVSCQQDLPKCFSMAPITFWKAIALVFSKGASLPQGVFAWTPISTLHVIIKKSGFRKKYFAKRSFAQIFFEKAFFENTFRKKSSWKHIFRNATNREATHFGPKRIKKFGACGGLRLYKLLSFLKSKSR